MVLTLLPPTPVKTQNDPIFKLWRLAHVFALVLIQCTWTPEVKTLIHRSDQGSVALQTSQKIKIPPQHPQILSELLIKQILQGISQTQDQGLLQELLISSPTSSPLFSPAQIAFLTPHLVDAFSQATSEELITFQSLGTQDKSPPISGTVALFPPSTFFLIIQSPTDAQRPLSKMRPSSQYPYQRATLAFSQKQAILQPNDVQRFVTISQQDLWIAIDYSAITPVQTKDREGRKYSVPKTFPHEIDAKEEMETLQNELYDLRRKIDEQEQKIQRLQQTTPAQTKAH